MLSAVQLNKTLLDQFNNPVDVLVTWGGGKDSTSALLLAASYAKKGVFKQLYILTIENYLTSETVLKNRKHIINHLIAEGVPHTWIVRSPGSKKELFAMYGNALKKTSFPRSVCMVCTMMVEKIKQEVINEYNIPYKISGEHITDNKTLFRHWAMNQIWRKELNLFEVDKNVVRNKIFNSWIKFLQPPNTKSTFYLSEEIKKCKKIPIFEYHPFFKNSSNKIRFIEKRGWKLPSYKEGVMGSETDCRFPAISYGLYLLRKESIEKYLEVTRKEQMVPSKILYRGISDEKNILFHTEQFLSEIHLNPQDWISKITPSPSIPKSMKAYFNKGLLTLR